jgi:hypothetical protein
MESPTSEQTLNEMHKAIVCLTEPTRLNIAMHLGIDNPANITRRIYNIGTKTGYSNIQYNLIIRHLVRMKRNGVIKHSNIIEGTKVRNYELTELGKEALSRKGYKVLSRY